MSKVCFNIIFDSDGVLGKCQEELLRRFNREYNMNFTLEDITCWDLTKIQPPGTDMIKYFTQDGFFRNLEVVENSQEVIKKLQSQGDNCFVCTDSPVEGLTDKALWLNENFPNIPRKNIGMMGFKHMLQGDIILDDAIHNLKPSSCRYPVLFDAPWNRDKKESEGLVRVYGFLDFFDVVQVIKRGCSYDELLNKRKNFERRCIV